jgi:hypothetical protein
MEEKTVIYNVVMSGSDPRGTRNADEDGGPSGVRRHGLGLVDTRITWMRMEVRTGPEGAGSDL